MSEKPRHILLEACVCSVSDAVSAVEHGADRLELNVAIELGGLTPTVGLLQQVKEAVDVPVLAMVRPRAGGFRYSTSEQRLMRRDAHALLKDGADGIVVGAMTKTPSTTHLKHQISNVKSAETQVTSFTRKRFWRTILHCLSLMARSPMNG